MGPDPGAQNIQTWSEIPITLVEVLSYWLFS